MSATPDQTSTGSDGTRPRSVVIGGGVSGLATACLLAREGHRVTLYERTSNLGGRAGTWRHNGFVFDTGPSWFLMPEVFDHFYRLMGTALHEQLDLLSLDPGYRVFFEPASERPAAFVDVRSGLANAEALAEQLEPGSGRAMREHLKSATRTYREALKHFLYQPAVGVRTVLRRDLLRLVPPLLPLLTRSLWSRVRRRFRNARLRQILAYPAVFLGTSPFDAPALYHLMSHLDLVDGVSYPRGGFTRFVDTLTSLAIDHGVELVCNTEVTAITSEHGHVSSVTVTEADRLNETDRLNEADKPRIVPADNVVSTIDEHHLETELLSRADRSYPDRRWTRQTSGPGAILLMLGVQGSLPQVPHHSLFFTHDWQSNFTAIFGDTPHIPNPASLYVCRPSATDDVAPAGHEALFVLVPVPADTSIGRGADPGCDTPEDSAVAATADRVIAQIAQWSGIPDLAERIVLRRTVGPADFHDQFHSFRGSALGPAHTLRQSAFLRGVTTSRRMRGLYYAGATTAPGVGLPMCLISAELVLKNIRGDRSPTPAAPASRMTDAQEGRR